MNKLQRKRLQEAQQMLDKVSEMLYDAMSIIEEVRDEEQEKLDNANEGQLATERFQTIEDGCDTLNELYDTLEIMLSVILYPNATEKLESLMCEIRALTKDYKI